MRDPVRVFLVDDSAIARVLLRRALEGDPHLRVVGEAASGHEALTRVPVSNADVILMDMVMPGMDGLAVTAALMERFPRPILIVSDLVGTDATLNFRALQSGALDLVRKPSHQELGAPETVEALRRRVRVLAGVPVVTRRRRASTEAPPSGQASCSATTRLDPSMIQLVCVGASTGGPQALIPIVRAIGPTPRTAVLVVQHMGPGFIGGMVSWLRDLSGAPIVLAEHGVRLAPGLVAIAPDGAHLTIRDGRVWLERSAPRNGHLPAVDALFDSVAASTLAPATLAILLTGMGSDGARGMVALRERGAWTIAQDEATSVVFGMPRVAAELGGVREQLALPRIADLVGRTCRP